MYSSIIYYLDIVLVFVCNFKDTFISYSSGGWKSAIRVPAWSGSGEDPLPGLLTWWSSLYSLLTSLSSLL